MIAQWTCINVKENICTCFVCSSLFKEIHTWNKGKHVFYIKDFFSYSNDTIWPKLKSWNVSIYVTAGNKNKKVPPASLFWAVKNLIKCLPPSSFLEKICLRNKLLFFDGLTPLKINCGLCWKIQCITDNIVRKGALWVTLLEKVYYGR